MPVRTDRDLQLWANLKMCENQRIILNRKNKCEKCHNSQKVYNYFISLKEFTLGFCATFRAALFRILQ